MGTDNIADITKERQRRNYLLQEETRKGMDVIGEIMKQACGIDLLKVAVIVEVITPLLRIERQYKAKLKRRIRRYEKIINTYDNEDCLALLNNSTDEQWKRRPVFFVLLIKKAVRANIVGLLE